MSVQPVGKLVIFFLFSLWLMPDRLLASPVTVSENYQKPHLAVDLSIQIPHDFNRYSSNSFLSIKDIKSPNRYLAATTKDLLPSEIYTTTLGGFTPSTSYEIQIPLNNAGENVFSETVQFTTSYPTDEKETLLMVIDKDLNTPELEKEYNLYIQSIIKQETNIDVEKYYLGTSYDEKVALYQYIRESYFEKNLYSIFFIGANGSFPVQIFLLDDDGNESYQYQYEGLSFYSHIWNNPYQYIEENDSYSIVYGLNDSSTPDLYTSLYNSTSMADISFGAFIPTSTDSLEKEQQVKHYLQKIKKYRYGLITYNRKVLYSDTMWGNDTVEQDLSDLPFYNENTAVTTSHSPHYEYHKQDDTWRDSYLSHLEEGSFEIAWLNVHGSPTHHYFGVSNHDIENLSRLNTAYISLQSCNTGNYLTSGYLAGTYLNTGNVLAVDANMYPTMYVGNSKTPFSENHTLHAVANGKKIGDSFRQHGSMRIGRILYGDPMLIIGPNSKKIPKASSEFWSLFLPIILENARRGTTMNLTGE